MANCQSYPLKGLDINCSGTTGGLVEVYICNYDDIKQSNIVVSEDKITGITMESAAKFKTYRFRKNTGSMVSTAEFNEQTGSRRVLTDLNLQFTKMETAKRLEMVALFNGQTRVIVKTMDGTYWFLGYDNYVSMKAGSGQTGTNGTDLNGYTLTLNDESKEFPYEVDSTIVEALVEAAPAPSDAGGVSA